MEIVGSLTERTTAATDALLALVALAGAVYLHRRSPAGLARSIWQWGLAAFGLAAALGAIAHGFALGERIHAAIWHPIYLLLGAAVALIAAGSVCAGFGERAAKRALIPLFAAAACFYLATIAAGGNFLVFVIFEVAGFLFALAVYLRLAIRGRAGAAAMALAMSVSILAGVVQAITHLRLRVIWDFDHNGLYHLVQLAGVILLPIGLRRSLAAGSPLDGETAPK